MDHGVGALVRSNVALIPHQCLQDMPRSYPNLTRTFCRETLIDAAISREWMIGLGRRLPISARPIFPANCTCA